MKRNAIRGMLNMEWFTPVYATTTSSTSSSSSRKRVAGSDLSSLL